MNVTKIALSVYLSIAPLMAIGEVRAAPPSDAADAMLGELAKMMIAIRVLAHDQQLGCDDGGVSLVVVLLARGQSYTLTRYWKADEHYVLVGLGDARARDIDLEVLDDVDPLVGDTGPAKTARFDFRPPRAGEYGIRLSLADADGGAVCSFAVLRRGGWNVPLSNLIAAGDNYVEQCRRVAMLAEWLGKRTRIPIGQATLWGGVFRGADSRTISQLALGSQYTFAVAAGDRQAANWDLDLQDSRGHILSADTRLSNTASAAILPQRGQSYAVRMRNSSKDGPPSFGMFGLVQVGD